MTRPARCAEHKDSFLTEDGECPEDECNYQAPDYSQNAAEIVYDSEWENTKEVSFEIDFIESGIGAPRDNTTPFVQAQVTFPHIGFCSAAVPMFYPGDGAESNELQKVYLSGHKHVVGIYRGGFYVQKCITDESGEFGQANDPWDDLYVEPTELVWDAEWPSTIDPMDDISLVNVDT